MSEHNPLRVGDILRRLLFEKNMKVIDLARATNVPQPTLQRIATGGCSRQPQMSSLLPIAQYFSLSVDQLLGKEPIPWLNQAHKKDLDEMGVRRVPLLEWSDIMNWILVSKDAEKRENFHKLRNPSILTETTVSEEAFALTIKDASMEPLFSSGCQVIFDPNKQIRDRSYVLVKLEQKEESIFRQLILDAGDRFIKPLSPDLEKFRMQMLEENDMILGVLVESKNQYL
ncbi:MAG: repressor protein [Gammaproteobacteria bacterium]|jgi:SOS-response transcriptional repressor LexA|nr:repressor protein [Gammaproteobacteria bacterium]